MDFLLFIGGPEIFIIMLFALLLFGSKKIPDIAKGLGKGIKEIKNATDQIKKEIEDTELTKDIKEIKDTINKKKLKG